MGLLNSGAETPFPGVPAASQSMAQQTSSGTLNSPQGSYNSPSNMTQDTLHNVPKQMYQQYPTVPMQAHMTQNVVGGVPMEFSNNSSLHHHHQQLYPQHQHSYPTQAMAQLYYAPTYTHSQLPHGIHGIHVHSPVGVMNPIFNIIPIPQIQQQPPHPHPHPHQHQHQHQHTHTPVVSTATHPPTPKQPRKIAGHEPAVSPRTTVFATGNTIGGTLQKDNIGSSSAPHTQYTQFVTTMIDSSTNKLVQITSQPPPDYVAAKKKRNRVTISCMSCKRRKVKCDRQRPICGSCEKNGYPVCIYSTDDGVDSNKVKKQCSSENSTNADLSFPGTIFDSEKEIEPGAFEAVDMSKIESNPNLKNTQTEIQDKQCERDELEKTPTLEFTALLKALDKLKLTHVQNDEIDHLRKKVEQLRFYLDDSSIVEFNILKGLSLIKNVILRPVLKASPFVPRTSSHLQFGASSITSYVDVDHYMGALFKKSLPKIEEDIEQWKSCFSVEIYRKALEKYIVYHNYGLNSGLCLNDIKKVKLQYISTLLEAYFIDYKTFSNLIQRSTIVMVKTVPVVPKRLIDLFVQEHFIESSEDSSLKIVKIETDEDFTEILLVLAVLRFGLPKSENVITTPDNIDYRNLLEKENINTDYKTDLLNSFLKIILNETDLSQIYNIPMLGTFVILFMISYTHRFNFKSGDPGLGLNYGIVAVCMAVNLGVYANTGFAYSTVDILDNNLENNKILSDEKGSTQRVNYMTILNETDFHNIWNLVMFVDTFSSFNSGIPQLTSSNMDNIFVTEFIDENCAQICSFYRKSFRLANKNITRDQEASILEYERFVIEFESFIVLKVKSASVCADIGDVVGVATAIRSLNLLLFLYYNSYFSFLNTVENFKEQNNEENNANYHAIMEQFDILEKRLFYRGIKLSMVSLIDLNIMLVSFFSTKDGFFYEKYSFDMIQLFTRVIYTLTTFICKMISVRKFETPSGTNEDAEKNKDNQKDSEFAFLFEISQKQCEDLSRFFISCQCSQALEENWASAYGDDIIELSESVDRLCQNPKAMIKLMIGFFFNTSQSLISQNFIYYALYKYFVMAVKEYNDSPGGVEDFDFDKFSAHYSYVNCTWFVNK